MNVLRLIPEAGGKAIEVDTDRARIGRESYCEIHLKDASVSRQHAEILRNDDEWVIVDSNSGNGILIDGEPATRAVLVPGQRLQFGSLLFRVEMDRGDEGHTVILGHTPLARGSSMKLNSTAVGPSRADTAGLRAATLIAGCVAVLAVALAVSYFWAARPVPVRQAVRTPPSTPTPTSDPTPTPTPTPTPAPPTPLPPAPPRAFLLISTEAEINVFVDGRRVGAFRAGQLRRMAVAPGEHLVSFQSGDSRQDRVVRIRANEQSVVRFPESTPPTTESPPSPPPAPSPSPSPPALPAR